ncbi:MAG TPA: universal stress protein [Phototrophicaceae bacterium]|nr:universal stress protein [Phototrophicaceae bacterium]
MNDDATDQEKGFSKILLAIDGSKPSIDAAEDAIEIAKNNKSKLIVIHVIDFYKYPYLLSATVLAPTFGSQRFDEDKKKAEEWIKTVKEKYVQSNAVNNGDADAKNLKTEIIEGKSSVAATIVDYAESKNVDLIVIGSRGVTGFKKMLVGSVTSDVVKYAHCSVLVIR